MSLINQIKTAIAKRNIPQLYELKDICDRIHQTGDSYKGYTIDDLPPDELYEEMVRTIREASNIVTEGLDNAIITSERQQHRLTHYIPELWMGSITKENEINEVEQAIITPKFDGCSCGVKLVRNKQQTPFQLSKAVTRGKNEAYEVKKADITEKFNTISSVLIEALSSKKANEFQFESNPPHTLGEAYGINIRGEIVLKDKTLTTSAPASVVAGKINGGMDVWNEYVTNLEFVPFEIIRVFWSINDKFDIYIPTQEETLALFKLLHLIEYPFIVKSLSSDSLPFIQEHFKKLTETVPEPLDGVVYCSIDWRYPRTYDQITPKQYGKLAWKPSSNATTILRSISYTLARDGKFTFILSYDPVTINGKTYRNAKTVTSRMKLLNGMGIGSVITIKLAGDISPMVTEFVPSDEIEPFVIPKKCPFCSTKTISGRGKNETLICPNPICPEVLKQKMLNFLSSLGIKGIADKKLEKLPTISLEQVNKAYMPKRALYDILTTTDTRTYLVALGIGGVQKVEKLLSQLPSNEYINPIESIATTYDDICYFLESYSEEDPFIADILDYTYKILFGKGSK